MKGSGTGSSDLLSIHGSIYDSGSSWNIDLSPLRVYTARAMLPTNQPKETDTHAAGSRKQLGIHNYLYMSAKQLPSAIKQTFFSHPLGRLQRHRGHNGLGAPRHICQPLRTGWEVFMDCLQCSQYSRIAVALPKAARLCHAQVCYPIGSGHLKEDPLN